MQYIVQFFIIKFMLIDINLIIKNDGIRVSDIPQFFIISILAFTTSRNNKKEWETRVSIFHNFLLFRYWLSPHLKIIKKNGKRE